MDMWLVWVSIASLLLVDEAADPYCKPVLTLNDSAAIVKVCQNNKATGSVIHLDSTGAPVGDEIVCTCDFTHYKDTDTQRVYILIIANTMEGIEFEFNNITFQHNSKSIQVNLDTGSAVTFRQKSGVQYARICLRLEALPNTDIITVECKAEQNRNESTSKQSTNQSNSFSTTSTNKIVPQTTGKQYGRTKSTVADRGVTDTSNPPETTESANSNTGDGAEDRLNVYVIGGAAGGGLFLIIVITVVVVVLRKRKKKPNEGKSEQENHAKGINDSDYYMTTNAHYVSADSAKTSLNRERQDVSLEMYTKQDNADYAVVQNSRTSDTGSRTIPGNENDYNHLHEIQPKSESHNVYDRPQAHKGVSNGHEPQYDTSNAVSDWKQNTVDEIYNTIA